MSAERVFKKKFLKVGVWQCGDLPADTVEVGLDGLNQKTLLNKSLNIYDVTRTMLCLSFPLIDRATKPGRYEQSYLNVLETLTKNAPYPQKLISRTQSDQTRSGNNIL